MVRSLSDDWEAQVAGSRGERGSGGAWLVAASGHGRPWRRGRTRHGEDDKSGRWGTSGSNGRRVTGVALASCAAGGRRGPGG